MKIELGKESLVGVIGVVGVAIFIIGLWTISSTLAIIVLGLVMIISSVIWAVEMSTTEKYSVSKQSDRVVIMSKGREVSSWSFSGKSDSAVANLVGHAYAECERMNLGVRNITPVD